MTDDDRSGPGSQCEGIFREPQKHFHYLLETVGGEDVLWVDAHLPECSGEVTAANAHAGDDVITDVADIPDNARHVGDELWVRVGGFPVGHDEGGRTNRCVEVGELFGLGNDCSQRDESLLKERRTSRAWVVAVGQLLTTSQRGERVENGSVQVAGLQENPVCAGCSGHHFNKRVVAGDDTLMLQSRHGAGIVRHHVDEQELCRSGYAHAHCQRGADLDRHSWLFESGL